MRTKLKMRRKILVSALVVLFIVSIIPVGAQMAPTLDGVISSGEWGEFDFTLIGYGGHVGYKVYVQNDLDYLYVAFVDQTGADYAVYGMTRIYIYPEDDYAGKCWVYEPSGPGWSTVLTYYTTHHIQSPKVTEGEEPLSTNSVVEVGLNVMEWKLPLDEFSAKPGDTIAFDLYSYMYGFTTEETTWIYEVYYTLWAPNTVDLNATVISDRAEVDLTATVIAPPVADAGGPYSGRPGRSISFDGTGSSDIDGTIEIYVWDFGDDETGTGPTPIHTYDKTGTYTVTLTVTDNDELTDSGTTDAFVSRPPSPAPSLNKEPHAKAGPNQKAWVGDTVHFDGSKSKDTDGTIESYEWDFGDGVTDSGVTVEHEYSEPGQYNVTLTVRDNRWSYDSDTCKVKISEPKPFSDKFAERVKGNKTGHVVDALEEANTTVTLDTTDDVTVTVLRYEDNPHPEDPIPAMALPTYVDVEVSDPDAVVWPIYVEMFYTDEEVMGLDESTFGIYYWFNGTWQRCSDTGVDTVLNIVWAYMTAEEASGSPILIAGMHAIPTPPVPPFLDNLTVTPSELELGDNVTISLDIMNPNNQTITYIVTMQIGELTLLVDVELEAHETKTISRTLTMGIIGDYSVTVDGMTGSFTVNPPLIPMEPAEFVVSELEVQPDEVEVGEDVTFTVLVTNIGETEGSYIVEFSVDGVIVDTQIVTLAAGSGSHAHARYEALSAGTYQVSVEDLTETFTVLAPLKPAEFVVSDLVLTPSEIEAGGTVIVSAKVANVGEMDGSYTVELKVDGETVDTESVTLAGGAVQYIDFTTSSEEEGEHTVEVDGLSDSFTVKSVPPPKKFPWTTILIVVVIIAAIAYVIIWVKPDWTKQLLSRIR